MSDLAPAPILDAFAATISYRLEPDGWATRFPLVLAHLLRGRLTHDQCEGALVELERIGAGLRGLDSDKAVWGLDDLRRRDDSGYPVDHRAASLYEYFRADDGRPLLEALREGVLAARASGRRVLITSPARSRSLLRAALTTLAGLAWLAGGYASFPNVVVVPGPHGSGGHAGFLAWPQGAVFVMVGLWRLTCTLLPALAEFDRRRAGLVYFAGGATWSLLVWLTWRA